jgi:hypothetical protein
MKPANPKILTINGGSSSIKFALFDAGDSLRRILAGGIERIGLPEACLCVKGSNQADNLSHPVAAPDHQCFDTAFHRDLPRVARKILEKEGLSDLSLRRVAQAAGVSTAAPYHHFADKRALLDAIAAEGFSTLREEMLARMEKEVDPRARREACGIAYVVFALDNPALFRLMFGGDDAPAADIALAGPRELTYEVLQ